MRIGYSQRSLRYVGLCGCSGPHLAKANYRPTEVERYVTAKQGALANKLRGILRRFAMAYARDALRTAGGARKADEGFEGLDDEARRKLLDSLDAESLGKELSGELETATTAAFRRAAVKGAIQVGFDVQGITKQLDRAALAYAKERGGELIKDLAGTTEDDMRDLLARAVEEGYSPGELQDAVERAGSFGEARAETIARTELAFAHVQGNVAGWKASGLVVRKRSILGDLHDVEDICDETADAGVVDMDEDFVEGYDFPPYHPNCVCDIEPVLPEPEEEDQQEDEE